jgi:hypothetical protein
MTPYLYVPSGAQHGPFALSKWRSLVCLAEYTAHDQITMVGITCRLYRDMDMPHVLYTVLGRRISL